MQKVGVIGGSGFYEFPGLEGIKRHVIETPYGNVEGVIEGVLEEGATVFFLPRHGASHGVPPHKVNYRANIYALHTLGVEYVIAFNAVGGIADNCAPSVIVVPDQIIDYTYGREHTFFDGFNGELNHIDFSTPFDESLRLALLSQLRNAELNYVSKGVYGCTQGPRLETSAEIQRMKRDGCDVVGMTLMPEAALAREKELKYVSLCLNVNWAAGIKNEETTLDKILALLELSVPEIREVIRKTIRFL